MACRFVKHARAAALALAAAGCSLATGASGGELAPGSAVVIRFTPARELVGVRPEGDSVRLGLVVSLAGRVRASDRRGHQIAVAFVRGPSDVAERAVPRGTRVNLAPDSGVAIQVLSRSPGLLNVLGVVWLPVLVLLFAWYLRHALG